MLQEASENAAVFLLQHFENSQSVTAVDTKILKSNFGPFPASIAVKSCEIVQKLLELLPDGALIKDKNSSLNKSKRYGHKLKVSVAEERQGMISDNSDSEWEEDKGDHFLSQFKEQLHLDQSKRPTDSFSAPSTKGTKERFKEERQTESSWLLNQCQAYFPNHESPEAMATALYDVLISSKNDAEIQNELFELVGFEAIDLIGQLLKKRKELVGSHDNRSDVKYKTSSKKPSVTSQVTIQVIWLQYLAHLII